MKAELVIKAVSDHFGLDYIQLTEQHTRKAEFIKAKFISYYFLSKLLNMDHTSIGKLFKSERRDHSRHDNVIRGLEKVNNYIETNSGYAQEIEDIKVKVSYALGLYVIDQEPDVLLPCFQENDFYHT